MKRFIECLVPDSFCNFKCSYCYVQQQSRKSKQRVFPQYEPSFIAKALSPERLGGISYINITGLGETLIQDTVVEIVHEILKTGNYVNITTNGTLDKRFKQLLDFDKNLLRHLNVSFSCHIIELEKHNMIDRFFNNIRKVQEAGCSFVLQVNLVDEYIPYWDRIKELALKNVGALPQVALTREETHSGYKIMTKRSFEDYKKIGREMHSPLFEFTINNFNKKQNGFCYAGCWSGTLNLYTGEMTSCYGQGIHQNIYENLNKPILFKPLGCCCADYCVNSSHYLSLGIIPQNNTPSYASLRNRELASWYNNEMKLFLSSKLKDENERVKYETIYTFFIPYIRIIKKFVRRWVLRIKKIVNEKFRKSSSIK